MDRLVSMPLMSANNIQTNIFEGSDWYACPIETYDRYATRPCPPADHCCHCPEHPGMNHGIGALYPKGEALLHYRSGAPSRAITLTGGIRSGFDWVALTEDSGKRAVVDLNGKATLRATITGGSPNLNFFMITPAVEDEVPAEPVGTTLSVSTDGNQMVISWEAGRSLESTSDLRSGEWNAVNGASSPYHSEISEAQMFYRVR